MQVHKKTIVNEAIEADVAILSLKHNAAPALESSPSHSV